MQSILTLILSLPYIEMPLHVISWIGWIVLFGILFILTLKAYTPELNTLKSFGIFFFLFLLNPLTSLFFGIRLPNESLLTLPGLPVELTSPIIILFIGLPWIFASGLLGPFSAVLLGIQSGFLVALWETHSLFTPLEYGFIAYAFSRLVTQNYQQRLFRLLRHPFISGICVVLVIFLVKGTSAFFAVNGSLAVRLDYALTGSFGITFAGWVEVLISSLLAELVYLSGLRLWKRPVTLVPSPLESSIKKRVVYLSAPVVMSVFIALTLADWWVAGDAAKEMVHLRLSGMAQIAAESLPYFLETGHSLIKVFAGDVELNHSSEEKLAENLSEQLRTVPFFRQFYLLDGTGTPITGYPEKDFSKLKMTEEEKAGIVSALAGVAVQTYTSSSYQNQNTAQVTYLAAIKDEQDIVTGVLLGIADFTSNPFTQPAVMALETIASTGGQGMIIDDANRILYHTYPGNIMSNYVGRIPGQAEFYDETSGLGTRNLVYFQPIVGRPWAVVLSVPAEQSQQMALEIAIPLFLILTILLVSAYLFITISLNKVSNSLILLAENASLIARGNLNDPVTQRSSDEVGRLAEAFEWMRLSLSARLEELNHLLLVSQSVASNLEVWDAVKPIVRAAMKDALMARIILVQDVSLRSESAKMVGNGIGEMSDQLAYLDEQIIDHCRYQDSLIITNTNRDKTLQFATNEVRPGAIIAFALRHENQFYGALWAAFKNPQEFGDEKLRFLNTLAGEAALAAANTRLYTNAELGRQRLEAVLASTPEPVMVFDKDLRLFLLNPVCFEISGLINEATPGLKVDGIINHPQLLQLIKSPVSDRSVYGEITLQNGKIYYASVSPVITGSTSLMGKICLLRDITHFKELDSMKSDFVATVSHDLRSPLTVMSGYATMIGMVGSLNEQQQGYIEKIKTSVDGMSKLVTTLLDLGRIEAGIGLQIEKVTIKEVLAEVINEIQPQAAQKKIKITSGICPEDTPIYMEVDRELFKQAILNLVDNAVKYTSLEGSVQISCKTIASTLQVVVHDNGIGIAPLDLPHMFEKFYRSGRKEAHQQKGTGLGLAIVKSIAERHRGRVWVESQLGKGSVFFFEIPLQRGG